MVTNVEEEIDLDWVKEVLDRYNPHLERAEGTIADYRFVESSWGLCATAYGNAFIPIDNERYVSFEEPQFMGTGNVSPFRLREWDQPSTYRHPSLGYSPDAFDRIFSLGPVGVNRLGEAFPDFFSGEKRLILLEGDEQNPDSVRELVNEIKDIGREPWEYVCMPVMHGGSMPLGEPFFEYLVGLHLVEEGFVVTRYGANNTRGVPDLFAYRVPMLAENFGGRFALEFILGPMGSVQTRFESSECSFAVEVEPTSTRVRSQGGSGVGQIKSQGYHRPFSGGLSAGPSDDTYTAGRIGMVTYGSNARKNVDYPDDLGDTDEETLYGFKEYVKFLLMDSKFDVLQDEADGFVDYVDRVSNLDLTDAIPVHSG